MIIKVDNQTVIKESCANIPTMFGEFSLCVYINVADKKEIKVISFGKTEGVPDLLVRIHSECFTGDVVGSLRCDCGDQLKKALQMIAQEGRGMVIYMPQEGRGIGLTEKLKAYNLQDVGFDTVEANLELGHEADTRDYAAAAIILKDMKVPSIRLMTNNPAKIENLKRYGMEITGRVPVICAVNHFNEHYLRTKQLKMNHILKSANGSSLQPGEGKPFITLTYAQSLDGSLASAGNGRLLLSGEQSAQMTHRLRAEHQAIMVGIGTVLTDDPQLTVRQAVGSNPQPVVLDGSLRIPADSYLVSGHPVKPWVITSETASADREKKLSSLGVRVFRLPAESDGRLNLVSVCGFLYDSGIKTLMVEGGLKVISSFLSTDLVDKVIITISPRFAGGRNVTIAVPAGGRFPELVSITQLQLGDDLIIEGYVKKDDRQETVLH